MYPIIIALNGRLAVNLLDQYMTPCTTLICADGAANSLMENKIVPSIILGDLDSIENETLSWYQEHTSVLHIPCQHSTDLEKAVEYAQNKITGKEIAVFGAHGTRPDHTLTNISILHACSRDITVSLVDEESFGIFLNADVKPKVLTFSSIPGETISLLPLNTVTGITTTGLHYQLRNESLQWSGRSGQSNLSTQQDIELRVSSGCLLVYVIGKPRTFVLEELTHS
jgi:thiamine pyrophosphokinase